MDDWIDQLTFINVTHPPRSPRSRELLQSTARAHTARLFHKRWKRQREARTDAAKSRSQLLSSAAGCSHNDHCNPSPAPVLSCPLEDHSLKIHVPLAVRVYLLLFIPHVQPLCDVLGFAQIWSTDVLEYIGHKHCFSSFSAIMLAAHEGVVASNSWTEPGQLVLNFRIAALDGVRQELERKSLADDSVLISILWLAVLSGRLRDLAQRDLHRKAIADLIKLRGGLHHISPGIRAWILQFEALWAMATGRTFLEKQVRPRLPGKMRGDIPRHLINKLPSGFLVLVRSGTISDRVIGALARTHEMLNRKSRPSNGVKESNSASRGTTEHSDPWEMVEYFSLPSKDEYTIDNLLLLGLVLFNYLASSYLPPWTLMALWTNMSRWVRTELTRKLLTCIIPRRVAEERCLLWLAKIAISSWQFEKGRLLVEGQMLASFARSRFSSLLKSNNKSERATEFFRYEKLEFDLASYTWEGD